MKRAFSLLEALLALALISLVLGLVAQGLNKLARLNAANQTASLKIELWSSLQRLSSELSGALTVVLPHSKEVRITRVDPSLNLQYNESRARLPWPWPAASSLGTGVLDPNRNPFVLNVAFVWVPGSGSIVEQTGAGSQNLVSGLTDWQVSLATDHRLLHIELIPKAGVRSLHATAYLPMVAAP